MQNSEIELWLIRHGETEWSKLGRHTSTTDVPLTKRGKTGSARIREYLSDREFSLVLTSPRQRARETCNIAGLGDVAHVDNNLREWDYGVLEGSSTTELRKIRPGWSIWDDTPPGGESLEEVAGRCHKIIDRSTASCGRVALFSHAHLLRILAAIWIGMEPGRGSLLALDSGSISTLGYERETRVIRTWNRSFEIA
jgi:broad specificity phosphatase PhoE